MAELLKAHEEAVEPIKLHNEAVHELNRRGPWLLDLLEWNGSPPAENLVFDGQDDQFVVSMMTAFQRDDPVWKTRGRDAHSVLEWGITSRKSHRACGFVHDPTTEFTRC